MTSTLFKHARTHNSLFLNCGWISGIGLKITMLLLWLIEPDVFQLPRLHKT